MVPLKAAASLHPSQRYLPFPSKPPFIQDIVETWIQNDQIFGFKDGLLAMLLSWHCPDPDQQAALNSPQSPLQPQSGTPCTWSSLWNATRYQLSILSDWSELWLLTDMAATAIVEFWLVLTFTCYLQVIYVQNGRNYAENLMSLHALKHWATYCEAKD